MLRMNSPVTALPALLPFRNLIPRIGRRTFISQTEPNVAILGGGITGLAAAYYLTKELPKAKVTIYEASDRLGGWLSSTRVPVKDGTVMFEAGPRTLRTANNGVLAARLMQELDLAKDAIFAQNSSPAARNRYIYYPDHLVRLPHPSFGLFSELWRTLQEPLFEGALWAAATEIFKNPRPKSVQDESVGDFWSRRLSKDIVDRAMSAFIHGVYAGDIYQLSAKSLFPVPWRDEVESDSVFGGMLKTRAGGIEMPTRQALFLQEMQKQHFDPLLRATLANTAVYTFKDGLGMLVDRLARHLLGLGSVHFRTSTTVDAVVPTEGKLGVQINARGSSQAESYTYAISALSPPHLNSVTRGLARTLVPPIPSVTVMTVNLYYRTPDLNPPGFGYLIPQATPFEQNPERALGVVFDTAYSPSQQDLDPENWLIQDAEQLKQARDQGQLVNVNDFAWYNLPELPLMQDHVKERGSKLTVMIGGHWWNDWPAFPDEKEGLAMAKSVVQRHLGIQEEPEVSQVNLQKDCIPQYTVGHEERLQTAHQNLLAEFNGRLRVTGNWMSGVGVNDCLRSAWDVVNGLKADRRETGLQHVGNELFVRVRPIPLDSQQVDEK